jgi:phage tail-like protein
MADRNAPIERGRFEVEIDGVVVAGWRRVELPRRYNAENASGEPQWGQPESDDLTMVRGVMKNDTTLHDWRKSVEEGKLDAARKDIDVVLLTETGTEQIRWTFTDAWPTEYVPPTLDTDPGGDQGDFAVAEVTLVFDKMTRA